MEFPRKVPRALCAKTDDLVFQVTDWFIPESDKAARELQQGQPYEPSDSEPSEYEMYLYGVTNDGDSVCAHVTGFQPYFFVKPPKTWWTKMGRNVSDLRNELLEGTRYNSRMKYTCKIIPRRLVDHLVSVETVMRKDFWGFTNGADFPFIKISVKSLALFNILQRYFKEKTDDGFQLYESNIDPFLRFIHERNIRPCGWVRLKAKKYGVAEDDARFARTSYNVTVEHNDVHAEDINKIAPLMIAAFDIECTSSHGDFPVASKTYRKLAMDLVNAGMVSTHRLEQEDVWKWVLGAFKSEITTPENATIHQLYLQEKIPQKVLANNLEPILDSVTSMVNCIVATKKAMRGSEEPAGEDEQEAEVPSQELSEQELALTDVLTKHLPKLKGDPIIQIGTTVHLYGSDKIVYRHIATLNSCDPIEDADVECFDTEDELIMGWRDLIVRLDPDILTGYNIFGFDMDYIWSRARELGEDENLGKGFGRLLERQTTLIQQRLSSSALGDNILKYIDLDGVVPIDMFKVMQRDHKLDSYKLDNVASVFLGDNKEDLKPREIFVKFGGDSKDRRDIATYCLQDCALCNRLLHKLKVLENNVGMANVCYVPLSYLFMRGQGVKIFSLVAKECKEKDYLIPVIKGFNPNMEDDSDGYEGAIVLEPKEGIYLDDPITVLDYSSLYPSSMIARNLSHDCFVNGEEFAHLEDQGITYQTVTYDVYEGKGDKKKCVGVKSCTFAQLPNGKKGIIPSILQKLLMQRKNTRKKIEYTRVYLTDGRIAQGLVTKEHDDGTLEMLNVDNANVCEGFGGCKATIPGDLVERREPAFSSFEQAVLDALQLAYKVTANSLYGQIGSRTSPIYWKDIAACTTATGREMIMTAKNFVEDKYDAEVIYGDSVPGDTPILVKDMQGLVHVKTIQTLSDEWIEYDNFRPWDPARSEKEQAGFEGYVWSSGTWARIARVIRHKVNKRMFRMNTFQGCVDVTEDHSIVNKHGKPVKPLECIPHETEILHSFPTFDDTFNSVPARLLCKEEAWVMGLFFADGSCDQMSWTINIQNLKTLNRAREYLEKVEDLSFNIIDSQLVPVGSIAYMVDKYRSLFYDRDKYKQVPSLILNASVEIKQWFLNGYLAGEEEPFECKGKIGAMGMYTLLRMIGYDKVRVNIRKDKDNIYTVRTITDNTYFDRDRDHVFSVTELPCTHGEYVYDIETSEGNFVAGVGNIVCFNTDSIFVKFPNHDENGKRVTGKEALPLAIAAGQRASQEIKSILPPPQCLEYEKTFFPFILFSKKRYVGNLYEDDATKKPKQKSMGIVLKRRDNANILKKVYGGIIDIILNKQDLPGSVEFLRTQLQNMLDGNVDLQDLIITKTLRAEYKDPTKIAHKVLADRMAARDPGNKPMANDRIPFVYVRPPANVEVKLQGDRIEHPEYIREKELKPDFHFYIKNQLVNPICQLYALCVEQLPSYSYSPGYWIQIDEELAGKDLYKDDRKRKDRITALRMKEAESLLFEEYLAQLDEVKRIVKKKASAKKVTEQEDNVSSSTVSLVVTENKEKKQYDCCATITDKDDVEIRKIECIVPKRRNATTKQYCYRYLAEMVFRETDAATLYSGVRFTVSDPKFVKTWKSAIVRHTDMHAHIQHAIKNADIGACNELHEESVFDNLVNVLERYPYSVHVKK